MSNPTYGIQPSGTSLPPPTDEQKEVIHHGEGHARVLAVAGSGKTSTMAHRIKFLIEERNVDPKRIRALMFNKLASDQFNEKIDKIQLPRLRKPYISTFHSFASQFIRRYIKAGLLPNYNFWIGENEERERVTLHRAIQYLTEKRIIPPDEIDVKDAMDAIGLWKGALIPPDRAGHRVNESLPHVYAQFEKMRIEQNGLTFNDFIPVVVDLLKQEKDLYQNWSGRVQHLIVDEYQDVNLGQQKLIELLAGDTADVMVVGDDDQTIYEWRGARSDYIIRDFEKAFPDKPHAIYKLSRTFRFGPVLAQCAHNMISMNANRQSKPVIAACVKKKSEVILIESHQDNKEDVHEVMTREIIRLVKDEKVCPSKIWILGRMYVQFAALEAHFLARNIPYEIVGQEPFYKRTEVQKLLDYVYLGKVFKDAITKQSKDALFRIINTPNRKISKKALGQAANGAQKKGESIAYLLTELIVNTATSLTGEARERAQSFLKVVQTIHDRIHRSDDNLTPDDLAGPLLEWVVNEIDFEKHFENYYGKGEHAYERIAAIKQFVSFAKATRKDPLDFLEHIKSLDATRGKPEKQVIKMATVFKTKGLEYDYVFIPSCQEGMMPALYDNEMATFDKSGQVRETDPSQAIENERRLFYVAITRAKRAVYIAAEHPSTAVASSGNPPVLPSRFLEEIRLNATTDVLNKLSVLSKMSREEVKDWTNLIRENAGQKHLMNNLEAYLYMLNDKYSGQISRWTSNIPEAPFKYTYAYGKRNWSDNGNDSTGLDDGGDIWGDIIDE